MERPASGHAWDFPPELDRKGTEQNKEPVSRQSALAQNNLDIDSHPCHRSVMCRHVGLLVGSVAETCEKLLYTELQLQLSAVRKLVHQLFCVREKQLTPCG